MTPFILLQEHAATCGWIAGTEDGRLIWVSGELFSDEAAKRALISDKLKRIKVTGEALIPDGTAHKTIELQKYTVANVATIRAAFHDDTWYVP